MERIFILILCIAGVCAAKAQSVTFLFPALPEKEVKAYFFQGAKLDSLSVQLDKEGKGSGKFPEAYHGFVQAIINNASLVEFIAGEDSLTIASDDLRPASQGVSYGNSEENRFFFSIMERKKQNEQEKGWLDAAPSLLERAGGEVLRREIKKALITNEQEKEAIDREVATSPLYAARFIEINNFADSLFHAENKQDTATIRYVKAYLQDEMDWKALYTAGQFWTMVHNYTLSMFNKESYNKRALTETQEEYVAFVKSLLMKVEGDIRIAMLESILRECQAFGWEQAEEELRTKS